MAMIVKLKNNVWGFPSNNIGKSRWYQFGGTFPLYSQDNSFVHFVDWDNSIYYVRGSDVIYVGPDTQKATITSVDASYFGQTAKINIENISKLKLELIVAMNELQINCGTVEDKYVLTLPYAWIDNVIDSDIGRVKFILRSYKEDNSYFGESVFEKDILIPEDILPSIDSVNILPKNKRVEKGFYNILSDIVCEIHASGVRNSIIKQVKILFEDKEYIANAKDNVYIAETTNGIEKSGKQTIKITVCDSRGRTKSLEKTIDVRPYFLPYMENISFVRTNASGKEVNEGEYAKLQGNIHVADGFDENIRVYNKGVLCSEKNRLYGPFEINKAYELQVIVSDGYFDASYNILLDSAYCIMNVKDRAVSIGGYAKEDGFEVYMPLAKNIRQKIQELAGESISYKKITIPPSSYDEQNLYTTKVLDTGNIFWIDEKSQVYSIKRQGNYITIFSNTSLENKTLNILSIKNSDMLVFVGLVQKTSNKTLYFNQENIDMWQRWLNRNARIDILEDRITIYASDKDRCEIQFATEEIDISKYSTLRLYAKSTRVDDSLGTRYEAKFGIYKKGLNMKSYQDNEFVACALATNIKDYRDLDISQINGNYMLGIGGKMQGEIYKMELIR